MTIELSHIKAVDINGGISGHVGGNAGVSGGTMTSSSIARYHSSFTIHVFGQYESDANSTNANLLLRTTNGDIICDVPIIDSDSVLTDHGPIHFSATFMSAGGYVRGVCHTGYVRITNTVSSDDENWAEVHTKRTSGYPSFTETNRNVYAQVSLFGDEIDTSKEYFMSITGV